MEAATSLEIREHDVRTAPDDVLAALHVLVAAFEQEAQPGERPTPFERARARCRAMPSFKDVRTWAAWSGGEVVASATAEIDRKGGNEHVVEAGILVRPDHRHRGVARRLLHPLADLAEMEGRHLLLGFTEAGVPAGEAFARRIGAQPGLVERASDLHLGEVDRELVRRWVADGPVRAAGYELVGVEGALPEELLVPFAELYDVTNTAPRDQLDVDDEHLTPEHVREYERSRRQAGVEDILFLARHRGSGALAGFTEVTWHPAQPWQVEQGWTAVHPDHRGRALGKWLKAAMVERILERWPAAEKVVTGNAYSNDAMVGINTELGFRETRAVTAWQVPLDRLRSYLSGP